MTEQEIRETRESDAVEELHRATNQLYEADSLEECYEITIHAAVNILGMDWCSLVAPADDVDMFEIKAISEEGTVAVGHRPFGLDEGLAGHVYQTKETHYVGDLSTSEIAKPTDETIKACLTVPVGEWGVFHAMSRQRDAFDERDRNWAELLCMSLGTAIERTERAARLESQNQRLEEFTSIVSHDLRNPLNVAQLRLDLAQDESDSEHLDDVAGALDRMERLVESLLILARQGEETGEREWVDLGTAARNCWRNVMTSDATLRVDGPPTVKAEQSRLQQLIENLFRNAIDHGGSAVTVTMGALETGFYVEDDGPGIPPDERKTVFESGYSTADHGMGFGLKIVAQVTEAHGWDVEVTEGTAGGARFEITGVTMAER
jgi:signal transduction histidine kinase